MALLQNPYMTPEQIAQAQKSLGLFTMGTTSVGGTPTPVPVTPQTSPTPISIMTSDSARTRTIQNQQSLNTTLQNIQLQTQQMLERIQKEGITSGKTGETLVKPGEFQIKPVGLINVSGSPATGVMTSQINQAAQQGVVDTKSFSDLKLKEAEAMSSLQNAQSSINDPRSLDYWMKKYDDQKNEYETALSDYYKNLEPLRQKREQLSLPGAREQELTKQLKDLRIQAEQFQVQKEKEKFEEFSGQTLGFAAGRASEIDIKASFKAQEQALQEKNLLLELGLEQEARKLSLGTVQQQIEDFASDFELRTKIEDKITDREDKLLEQINKLSDDSRSVIKDMLDNLEGFSWDDLGGESQDRISDLAEQAGIPIDLISDALLAQKARFIYEQQGRVPAGIEEFQTLYPGVDVSTPQGRRQYMSFLQQKGLAGATGQIINLNRPLSLQELQAYGLPAGATLQNAIGVTPLAPSARTKLSEIQAAIPLVGSLRNLVSQIELAPTLQDTATYGPTLYIQSFHPATQAGQYMSQRNAFVALITRALGEKGTLATYDVERIVKALPGFFDTKESAENKLSNLENIMNQVHERFKSGYYDTAQEAEQSEESYTKEDQDYVSGLGY